jgi:elongation factor G
MGTDVASRRSFALVGHTGDGKTSLGEALLHVAGATAARGSVDAGTSLLDAAPEERERHHTLSPAVFCFPWQEAQLALVDTPGDPNFQAQGQIALHALDGAVLVVSAVDGVKVGTESMWRACERLGLPVLAFVNGLDRERADFAAAVTSLAAMDARPAPLVLPLGAGATFRGVVDLVGRRAFLDGKPAEVPREVAEEVEAARRALVESVAECDDALLEKYLEHGELSEEELSEGLVAGVRARRLLPVLGGVATGEVGAQILLRAVVDLLPSPADRGAWRASRVGGDGAVEARPDPAGPLAAVVFKTHIDRYAGTLSYLRVVSGTLRGDTSILNATKGNRERLGKLLLPRGSEHAELPEAGPGDVVAVAKLKDVHTGNVLTDERGGIRLAEIPIPHGALSYAISARSRGDEDKVFSALARVVEEDPTLQVGREPSTGEFLLTGMGELHIRLTVEKLRRAYEAEVELKTPKVPYRETITRRVENVEGKLKKQTGGKGMFGVCYLTVEPLPRGAGLEFSDEIVGGAIPRNLIPAVDKGIQEAAVHGPLAGYPVVDVRVRCIDGKYHSVDSNEMAFKIAGSVGFKTALEKAHPTLLEPIMNAEIVVPEESVGDVMGDISSRRGRVQTSEVRGHGQVVKAQVPMAEMLEYASTLTSLTGGKGAFHMEFSHYDEVPAHLRERIVAEAKAREAGEA